MQCKFQKNGEIIQGDLKIASEIPTTNNHTYMESLLPGHSDSVFSFDFVTSYDVGQVIKKLSNKKSYGYDQISSDLVKKTCHSITYPLSILINQSLYNRVVPERLKIAKVIPLHKKNADNVFDNYRPISLLPAFSKIYEKIVYKQLYSYLISNNLIFDSQHGFREKFSTETAILELTDFIKRQIDTHHYPLGIFLDLSKAFDTINHDILILKLKSMDVGSNAMEWFTSYLQNRK